MNFTSPDISTFKHNLDSSIEAIRKHKKESHAAIKIDSLLNVTIYVMATRFLEASIKHIVYNCCQFRGDTQSELSRLYSRLKSFNNPEFKHIKRLFFKEMNFNILTGKCLGLYSQKDITLLDEIIKNRHENVHATHDPIHWYNTNTKDLINDFEKEYLGLLNILLYLESIEYNDGLHKFEYSN